MGMAEYRRQVGSTYYNSYGHAARLGLMGGAVRGAVAIGHPAYNAGSLIHPAMGGIMAAAAAPFGVVAGSAHGLVRNVTHHTLDKIIGRTNQALVDVLTKKRAARPSMQRSIKNAQFEAKHRRVRGKFA